MRGVWIAESVGDAAPANTKIIEKTLSLSPAIDRGTFSLSKGNRDFPPGKYRLEIYVENELMKTVPFTIGEAGH